ncbi:tetratricopeptide (TPR) repeat protein [Kibdelosporangium banguiense]|uniref:Tetratricopeptide (TPR) repeat protein n=1 Tax=Kibdelosporangium banguiense TaxID=1365924 RepID=A0ABS4U1A6_9PSEU|nr:tetratricopeptide repeat protein [Kibdelosporangium banguiense]MBP2330432.1 tetratricopeptide (TPR) repeat protein [Kibdelosporangium banguiense]
MSEGDTHNELSGSAVNVVQARDISGGVHIHHIAVAELPIPRQLPPDVGHFVDREKHIERLHVWLDTPHDRAAPAEVIAGAGGVGKTSLAAHWAHQVRDRFPDGDLYLDLRGYHVERSLSASEGLDYVLRALGVTGERLPVALDAKAALYRSMLHGRRILVLLDNAATTEQIRPLLPGSPTCRVVITSRSRLTGLMIKEGAHRMPLDTLPPDRAIELLEQVAGDRVRDDPASTAKLAEYCGHLPLALRIAAERLVASPHLTVADLVEELAEERERLDALDSGDDEFTNVRAVFSWSYRALPADAARMFRLLGLVTGPDISGAAAAVLAGLPAVKARRVLDALVGAHLLQVNGPHRYRFHDLLRVYAAHCAENDESETDRQAALHRLFTWYAYSIEAAAQVITPHFSRIPISVAEPVAPAPDFPDRLTALHWCDSEQANLVAAVQQAADVGEHTLAWQMPVGLFAFCLVRRPLADWVTTHLVGLASVRHDGDRLAEVWLQNSIALAYRDLRQYDSALEYFQLALAGWRAEGVRWGEAWALRDIGGVYNLLGRNAEAIGTLNESLAIHLEEDDTWGEATALALLARANHSLGQFEQALPQLDRALEIRRDHGDQRNVGNALNDLSQLHDSLGQFDQAMAEAEEALDIHRAVEYWHGEATAHERLAAVLDHTGQAEAAAEHWRAAITLYDKLGDPRADDIRNR